MRLSILTPRDDETLLEQVGLTDIQLFYATFTFKGWVGSAN